MSVYGEIAALLTSVCWAFNSVVFTLAGKRVGSVTINYVRLWIAFPALLLIHGLLFGTPFPFDIEPTRFFYLAVSGLIGLIAGDAMLFESFLLIGPRLALLVALLGPVFSALLAGVFLGESMTALEIASILITIGGIGWVVAEEKMPGQESVSRTPGKYRLGILLAVGGAAGQAGGLFFSRLGMEGGYSAVSATLVRIAVAALTLVVYCLVRGKLRFHLARMKDRTAFLEITSGALTGPVLGVILSLVAIAHTHLGVASTLMSLTPVLLLPVSHFLFKEKITLRAIFGTTIALSGVVLLFLT